MERLQWYGYMHQNRTIHIKCYWDKIDIVEARESDFVRSVFGPISAETKEEAQKIIYAHYGVK